MIHSWFFALIASTMMLHTITIPETASSGEPYDLTSVEQLMDPAYARQIDSFYQEGEWGSFPGKEGIPIHYRIYRQEASGSPAILISSGRTEAAVKYKEVIYDLFRNGYSVYIHDHRGQGLSGRMTDDPDMGYIDTFQFYIEDLKTFYDQFLAPSGHSRRFLLAHSMGGAIGMAYLQQYPEDFHAAAFSSPMLGLKSPICPLAAVLNSRRPKYGPGQSGYDREKYPFEENSVTGSEVRYERSLDAFDRQPDARLGGASIQWVHRSCKAIKKIFREIDRLETPFLLFSTRQEAVVDPKSHGKFVTRAIKQGKDATLIYVEDARHELLMEKDEQRNTTLSQILSYFRDI